MMTPAVALRAQELAAARVPFVTATVVRAQRPTSARAGNVAIVLADGTVEGFIGGVCAEQSVRAYSLHVMETEQAMLLRILPEATAVDRPAGAGEIDGPPASTGGASHSAADALGAQEGAVTVRNSCLSGGAIEVFLEPVLPGPRVMVVGETPIAAAMLRLGVELGLDVVAADGGTLDPRPGDLALVVASHGRDEVNALERALAAAVPYIGLVASRRRGTGVISELKRAGLADGVLELIDVPAGIDIGARSPAEIALSILAKIVAVRRAPATSRSPGRGVTAAASTDPASPALAVDPVCGMAVAAAGGTPSLQRGGETVYFCGDGCKAKFEAEHEHAVAAP